LTNWQEEEFKNNNTRTTDFSALRQFKKANNMKDLGEFLIGNSNIVNDLKKFFTLIVAFFCKTK
jgi:hypothetical protein